MDSFSLILRMRSCTLLTYTDFFWNVQFFKAINFGFYQLFGFFPRPTLSRRHEGNLAYLMLITVVNAPDVNAPYHI